MITTYAGTGAVGNDGDGGQAAAATLDHPGALHFGPDGSLYVATGDRLRRISESGEISTVFLLPSSGLVKGLQDFAVDSDGSVVVCDANRVFRWRSGDWTVLAGNAGLWGDADWDGAHAASSDLNAPASIAIGPDRQVYISEFFGYRVRRIDQAGRLWIVAGTGEGGGTGDGGPATRATLSQPWGLTFASDGSLLVGASDEGHDVRRVLTNGTIETYAVSERNVSRALAVTPNGALYAAALDPIVLRTTP